MHHQWWPYNSEQSGHVILVSELFLFRACTVAQLLYCGKKARSNPDRFLAIHPRHENLLTKVARATREQYYPTLLESSIGNSKKIWSNINCILGGKHSSISTTIKLNGIGVPKPETIANAFTSYFNSIRVTLSDNINNNLSAFESCLDDQIPQYYEFNK